MSLPENPFFPIPARARRCGLLAALALLALGNGHADVKVGDTFPWSALTAAGPDAVPATAGQVALVDFWASWCAPCRSSFPVYGRLQADYRAKGLIVLAVSVDEQAAAYATFLKRFAPTFAVTRDASHALAREVGVPAMPTCYLLGRDGRVRFVLQGFHDDQSDEILRKEIDTLLAEPRSSS